MGNHGGTRSAMARRAGAMARRGGQQSPAPTPLPTARETYRGTDMQRLDPYQALEDFGREQLRAVLERDTQRRLRTAVDAVQARNPGTAPRSRSRVADMVDYIMEHVAGEKPTERPAAEAPAPKSPRAPKLSVDEAHAALERAVRDGTRAEREAAARALVKALDQQAKASRDGKSIRQIEREARYAGPKLEIRHPEALARHNPLMPFDPYEIDAAYEHDQVRRFFTPLTQRELRKSIQIVMARNPGTKPRNMSVNADMVDYIVEHVAGPGY